MSKQSIIEEYKFEIEICAGIIPDIVNIVFDYISIIVTSVQKTSRHDLESIGKYTRGFSSSRGTRVHVDPTLLYILSNSCLNKYYHQSPEQLKKEMEENEEKFKADRGALKGDFPQSVARTFIFRDCHTSFCNFAHVYHFLRSFDNDSLIQDYSFDINNYFTKNEKLDSIYLVTGRTGEPLLYCTTHSALKLIREELESVQQCGENNKVDFRWL